MRRYRRTVHEIPSIVPSTKASVDATISEKHKAANVTLNPLMVMDLIIHCCQPMAKMVAVAIREKSFIPSGNALSNVILENRSQILRANVEEDMIFVQSVKSVAKRVHEWASANPAELQLVGIDLFQDMVDLSKRRISYDKNPPDSEMARDIISRAVNFAAPLFKNAFDIDRSYWKQMSSSKTFFPWMFWSALGNADFFLTIPTYNSAIVFTDVKRPEIDNVVEGQNEKLFQPTYYDVSSPTDSFRLLNSFHRFGNNERLNA